MVRQRNEKRGTGRPGFTLIELLVVTGLILLLATLTVAIVAQSVDQDRVRQGADQMQGWLIMAKQYALRNKVPTGIRFSTTDPDTGLQTPYVRSALYIEQPDDFVGPPGAAINIWTNTTTAPPTPTSSPPGGWPTGILPYNSTVLAGKKPKGKPNNPSLDVSGITVWAPTSTVDFTGGQTWDASVMQQLGANGLLASIDPVLFQAAYPQATNGVPANNPILENFAKLWPVQVGDFLELGQPGSPTAQLYQIQAIYAVNYLGAMQPVLYCASYSPSYADAPQLSPRTDWRIVRQMRPKLGEQPLLFPKNAIIDTRTLAWYPQPNSPTVLPDIVFEPSGTVRAPAGGNAQQPIYLWFVDNSKDLPPTTQPANNPPYYTNKTYVGKQFIVTVNPQNGFIAVHPADTTTDANGMYVNPYNFGQMTDDNVFSGL